MPDEEPLSPEELAEAHAHLLLARYGVVARELVATGWATLRQALTRMEYGGEALRGYFVEGLSGEQYALEEALDDLASPARRGASHVLVAAGDPANLWGRVFTLTTAAGARVTAPRAADWLVLRHGAPVALISAHGREVATLAGWQPSDAAGVAEAINTMLARPASCRPVRRVDIGTWDGQPIGTADSFPVFRAAGLA
jgi:ATP-dependent Lhr-like helicase